jgi:ubiquinone biosynthesis protein
LINELPSEVNEILYKVKEGKLTHEINLVNKKELQNSISKFSYRIALALLLGFMMMTAAVMMVWGKGDSTIANILLTVSTIMAVMMSFRWFFKSRQPS